MEKTEAEKNWRAAEDKVRALKAEREALLAGPYTPDQYGALERKIMVAEAEARVAYKPVAEAEAKERASQNRRHRAFHRNIDK